MYSYDQPKTRRSHFGLVTEASVKHHWGRISLPNGKVHYIRYAIVRWNFNGGTWNKPNITFVLACGPQHSRPDFVKPPPIENYAYAVCARCLNHYNKDRRD